MTTVTATTARKPTCSDRIYAAQFAADVPPVAFGVEVLLGDPRGRAGYRCAVWRDADTGGWCARTDRGVFLMDEEAARTYLRTRRDGCGRPIELTGDTGLQLAVCAVGDLRARANTARAVERMRAGA